MSDFAALIGLDWAEHQHALCLIDPVSGQRAASILPHSPQALDEWVTALRARYGGQPVAVCLEQSRGPLLYALLKYDFFTLYPVKRALACPLPRGFRAFAP